MSEGKQLRRAEKHQRVISKKYTSEEALAADKTIESVTKQTKELSISDTSNISNNKATSDACWYVADKTHLPLAARFLEANVDSLEEHLSQLSANTSQLPVVDRYIKNLIETISVENFELSGFELKRVSASLEPGGLIQSILIDALSLKYLISLVRDKTVSSEIPTYFLGTTSVLKQVIERLNNKELLPTAVRLAFDAVAKERKKEPLDILNDLIFCRVSFNIPKKGTPVLPASHIVQLIVAFDQAYPSLLDPKTSAPLLDFLEAKAEEVLENRDDILEFNSVFSSGTFQKVLHLLEVKKDNKERIRRLSRKLLTNINSVIGSRIICRDKKMENSSNEDKTEPLSPPSNRFPLCSPNSSSCGEHLTNVITDLGPACTSNLGTLRDTFSEVSKSLSSSRPDDNKSSVTIDESATARLIWFFADKGSQSAASSAEDYNHSAALVNTLVPSSSLEDVNNSSSKNYWNLNVVSQFLSEKFSSTLDWSLVAKSFDFPEFVIRNPTHFNTMLTLYKSAAKMDLPPQSTFSEWKNQSGQLSLIELVVAASPEIITLKVNEAEAEDAATAADRCANKAWSSVDLLQRLLSLSDVPPLARRVRDLFVKGVLTCPEVLLCALVRLQLSTPNSSNNNDNAESSVGIQLKNELMRELKRLFFKPNVHHRPQDSSAAIKRLWNISPNTVIAACIEMWRSTSNEPPLSRLATATHVVGITQLIPESVAGILNNTKDFEFSIGVAFVMADNDLIQLNTWLNERLSSSGGLMFCVSLVAYMGKYFTIAAPRKNGGNDIHSLDSLITLQNLVIGVQFLNSLERNILSQSVPTVGNANDSSSSNVVLGDNVKALTEACLSKHPSMSTFFPGISSNSSPPDPGAVLSTSEANNPDDIEEMANSYFQKIYASEQSIMEVIEMLKRFKLSGNTRENDIFACMIHNLFDEYRFFSKYPEKELRITGILFGQLIENQLVTSITLGIALRYVLEALRKPPGPPGNTTSNSGKMFRFGMFALEQFKSRLHEWPQYCSHIVQIPHLKQGYADLVAEIEGAMAESQSKGSASGTVSVSSNSSPMGVAASGDTDEGTTPTVLASQDESKYAENDVPKTQSSQINEKDANSFQSNPFGPGVSAIPGSDRSQVRDLGVPAPKSLIPPTYVTSFSNERQQPSITPVAVFGPKLGRAVNGKVEHVDHEAPTDAVSDRVQFLINNVSPSNVEQKTRELKEVLAPEYFAWLGNYLVVKRISTQPNFHSLYLTFLDNLGGDFGKGLVEAILSSVYVNVGKLLRSPKITTSTSERSLLKNLGSWLGQITLARNRPILQIMLDCKELLFQGYETGMLIAVTPFVAKILEGAKNSVVFKPPNPWLVGLLSVFRALYEVADLKMNIKFVVEVLCKDLGVKLEDIPIRSDELSKRIPPVKERNPDFHLKISMASQNTGANQATPSSNNVAPPRAAAPSSPSTTGKHVLPYAPASAFGSSIGASSSDNRNFASTSTQPSQNSSEQLQTVIPNLAAYITINPSLNVLFQQAQGATSVNISASSLKRVVPIAVDRAIREIIQPVVERSVTIACITTKEIVTKDFAMESDENIMRKAAQLMVANLAGSLALVTCREPLRVSVSTHLRQLLTNSTGNGNNSSQPSEQEQSLVEQCVSVCSTDNLELGCMLIEKAATEKAVRDMDEALSPALNARRNHRETTGQPFYDMSIFGNGGSRFPAALPDPLRPKPGGLRPEQLLVYEAFQRMPRQPTMMAQQGGSNNGNGGANVGVSSPGGSTSPIISGRLPNNMNSGAAIQGSKAAAPVSSSTNNTSSGQSAIGLDALSAIAVKLDTAVTALLSAAGQRAPEITLSMLPPDHDIKQLLLAVQRVAITSTSTGPGNVRRVLSSAETDSILVFAQSVFKRLYDLSLTEPLRLEALVALLEALNECFPQLGQDLCIWVTYAPTETEGQRKLHRTILLLLVRSRLISVKEVDGFLSRSMDGGRNSTWVEFSLLFVRTAVLERIASASDMSEVMAILAKVADGKVQGGQQIDQSYLKLIRRLLDELRASPVASDEQQLSSIPPNTIGDDNSNVLSTTQTNRQPLTFQQSTSIGPVSLNNLAGGTKKALESVEILARNDPPSLRRQVTFLLDSWIRIQSEALGNEKALAQYLQLLHQHGIGKADDMTERFIRVSMELVVEAVLKSAQVDVNTGNSGKDTQTKTYNYNVLDAFAKLIALIGAQRVSLLNKVLATLARTLMANYERCKQENGGVVPHWDQRPWFRIFLNLIHDLNTPSPALDPISFGILSVFGSSFHVLQPLVVPGFAFAWLELVSHRMFLSNLLLVKGQKGWAMAHQLLIDLFLFLEPHLRKTELTDAIKHLYKGTLRVLLVLLHDFPSFLAGYHLSLCNVIPENCIQLRNLVLSAFPRGMVLPDPFTPNLKIDLLPEISRNPVILSDVLGPLGDIRADLDDYLKTRQPSTFMSLLLPRLYKEGTNDVDAPRVNSLVLYVGMQSISRGQNTQIAHTPEMEILQKLMELDDRGRYVSLNALSNQLRYPSSHTHYFSCVILFLFSEAKDEGIKEQITRVLLERLIVHRPHPWGLLITFIELIKNQRYQFWSHSFTRCATEIEKVFESVARSCMTPPESQRVVGVDEPQ